MTKNIDVTLSDNAVALVSIDLDGTNYRAHLVGIPGTEPPTPRIAAQILHALADQLELEDISPEDITGG